MKLQMPKTATLLLYLLLVAGLTLSSFGDVLCISGDGYAKIESVCQPCCSKSDDTCSLTEPDSGQSHHDSCDNCSDLPLDGPILHRRKAESAIDVCYVTPIPALAFGYSADRVRPAATLFDIHYSFPEQYKSALLISTTVLNC